MNLKCDTHRRIATLLLLVLAAAASTLAQDGKLVLHATPEQAYVFVDGRALGQAGHTFSLSAGDHKIDVVNYGYTPNSQTVSIASGATTDLKVTLSPVTETVAGPWGAMTIEGAGHDAILLNGKTPEFFVGQADEFNHDWWWKQELVVPPGTYQVTVLAADKEVWSGPVEVPADQRVVIDVPKGVRKTVPWSRGQKLTAPPRFSVGTASATVVVAKPVAQLSANAAQINCGDTSQLQWSSSDAPHVEISNVGPVAASGGQGVQPKQTTTYELTALGPGGKTASSATVNVNNAIQANLTLSPAEMRYQRVGDKVVEEGNTALNWSAANADTVSIDPLGSVSSSGSRTLPVVPRKTDPGPVDETVAYTRNATNPCGGTATQTATLHIVGSIEIPDLAINSVYFPTDVPRSISSGDGLVASQKATLASVAEAFKRYLQFKPQTHLILGGHADERGTDEYNRDLSERRAQLAKSFLTEQGIPADNLEIQAYGKEQNLSADQVRQLVEENSELSEEERQSALQRMHTLVLANNRRVDITLSTTGQESTRRYPFKADDYAKLLDRNSATRGGVELASQKKKIEN